MRVTAAITILLLVAMGALALVPHTEPESPPQPGGDSGGGGCTYCNQTACGCAAPPPGYYLRFSCACSTIDCSRTCTYYPL